MACGRLGAGIVYGLVACLSVSVLLLGLELSAALGGASELAARDSALLAAAAALLYGAVSLRRARDGGWKTLAGSWVALIGAHAALGLAAGAVGAASHASAARPVEIARWAAGASLPLAVLQVGYSVGVVALLWGREMEAAAVGAPLGPGEALPSADPLPGPAPSAPPARPASEGPARLEVYARAVERVRAHDYDGLIRFAAEAARCQSALLATPDGLLVAATSDADLEPARLAALLPELLHSLEALSLAAGGATTLLHAACGGHEFLAVPGTRLIGCLIGPQPGARDAAEIILPVMVARAESLWTSQQLGVSAPR